MSLTKKIQILNGEVMVQGVNYQYCVEIRKELKQVWPGNVKWEMNTKINCPAGGLSIEFRNTDIAQALFVAAWNTMQTAIAKEEGYQTTIPVEVILQKTQETVRSLMTEKQEQKST